MNDYKETYVTCETAKLLDKAGFDYKCRYFYLHDGTTRWQYTHLTVLPKKEKVINAPTQAQAVRWIREKLRIKIDAEERAFFQERPKKEYYCWCPLIIRLSNSNVKLNPFHTQKLDSDDFYHSGYKAFYDSYEEAIEDAIRYFLQEKLLKETDDEKKE